MTSIFESDYPIGYTRSVGYIILITSLFFPSIIIGSIIEGLTNSYELGLIGMGVSFFCFSFIIIFFLYQKYTEDKRKMRNYIDRELDK